MYEKKIAIKFRGFWDKNLPLGGHRKITPQFFSAEPQQHDTNDHRIELMDTTTLVTAQAALEAAKPGENFNWASDLQLVVLRHPLLATAPEAVDVFMVFFRDFLSSKMMPKKRVKSCYICPRVSNLPESEDNGDFESTSTMSWFLEFPQHPTVKNTMSKAICLWSTAHNRFQPRLGRNLRNGDPVELVTERCNIRKVLPCLYFALFRAFP